MSCCVCIFDTVLQLHQASVAKDLTGYIDCSSEQCLQDKSDPSTQRFNEVKIVVHEAYRYGVSQDFDIAVLQLSTAMNVNDYVQPVCLPSSPVAVGANCVVSGWSINRSKQNIEHLVFPPSSVYTSALCAADKAKFIVVCCAPLSYLFIYLFNDKEQRAIRPLTGCIQQYAG